MTSVEEGQVRSRFLWFDQKKKVRRIELKNALIHLDRGHSYSQFYSATQKLLYLKLQLENKILETK